MNSTNNISARAAFDHARKMFFNAFIGDFVKKFGPGEKARMECQNYVDSLKLSQSEIRTEVALTATANRFQFGVTINQVSTGASGVFNTENRLQLQDSLCVNEFGIFVGKPASSTDTAWNLQTYANPNIFTANAATALNTTFYSNGAFRLLCNNDVLVPYRGLYNHKYVPQTQQSGVTASATVPLYADQIRGAEDGIVTSEPNIVLSGSKNNIPEIVLPSALANVDSGQRAVLIFRGILAQNSTVVS